MVPDFGDCTRAHEARSIHGCGLQREVEAATIATVAWLKEAGLEQSMSSGCERLLCRHVEPLKGEGAALAFESCPFGGLGGAGRRYACGGNTLA